jgi:hypothetical protein
MVEVVKVNAGLEDRRVLPSLLRKDVGSGCKTGLVKAQKKKGLPVALGPTSVTVGTYTRFKVASNKLGIPLADAWRIVLHAMLPRFEKAAANMPQPVVEKKVACPHCGG